MSQGYPTPALGPADSLVAPHVAIMNKLWLQWVSDAPGNDTVGNPDQFHQLNTQDPTKVHFTTRRYAYAPNRLHTYQVSVRLGSTERFTAIQFGQISKYVADTPILLDVWVLTGPQQSIELAEPYRFNMVTEIKRVLRIYSVNMGNGIQSVLLDTAVNDDSALEGNPPALHTIVRATAKMFLTGFT
jgi:hypothetical protein